MKKRKFNAATFLTSLIVSLSFGMSQQCGAVSSEAEKPLVKSLRKIRRNIKEVPSVVKCVAVGAGVGACYSAGDFVYNKYTKGQHPKGSGSNIPSQAAVSKETNENNTFKIDRISEDYSLYKDSSENNVYSAPAADVSNEKLGNFWKEILELRKKDFPKYRDFEETTREVETVLKNESCMLSLEGDADTFIVGDIHANVAALEFVVNHFLQEVANGNKKARIVFLGDYVDRGQQGPGGGNSMKVLYTLMKLKTLLPNNVFLQRGNHEESISLNTQNTMGAYGSFLKMRGKKDSANDFLNNGLYVRNEDKEDFENVIVKRFYNNLPLCSEIKFSEKKYFVAHGGPPVMVENYEELFKRLKSTRDKGSAFEIPPSNAKKLYFEDSVLSSFRNENNLKGSSDEDFFKKMKEEATKYGGIVGRERDVFGNWKYFSYKCDLVHYFTDRYGNILDKTTVSDLSIGKQILWNDYGGSGKVSKDGTKVNGYTREINKRGTATNYFSGDLEKIKKETSITNFISAHCHGIPNGYEHKDLKDGVEFSRVMCSPNMDIGEYKNGHLLLIKEKGKKVEDVLIQYDRYWNKSSSTFKLGNNVFFDRNNKKVLYSKKNLSLVFK